MKKLLLLLAVAFLSTTFIGCEEAIEDNGVKGTTWEANVGETTLVLNFIDATTCTIASNKQGVYTAKTERYFYAYYDVRDFSLYKKPTDSTAITYYIANVIDHNELRLKRVIDNPNNTDYITLRKKS